MTNKLFYHSQWPSEILLSEILCCDFQVLITSSHFSLQEKKRGCIILPTSSRHLKLSHRFLRFSTLTTIQHFHNHNIFFPLKCIIQFILSLFVFAHLPWYQSQQPQIHSELLSILHRTSPNWFQSCIFSCISLPNFFHIIAVLIKIHWSTANISSN